MKIDPPAPPAVPLTRTPKGSSTPSPAEVDAARPAKEAASMSGKIHPLPSPADGSDFDAARVAAIREDIRAGNYEVRPERIADGLLRSVRELLDPAKKP